MDTIDLWTKVQDMGSGQLCVVVDFPGQPVHLRPGESHSALYRCALPEDTVMHRIDTFIGVDRGNLCEADIQVYSEGGGYLAQRSDHHEAPSFYDAWRSQQLYWPCLPWLYFSLHAHPTGDTPINVHWSVRLRLGA